METSHDIYAADARGLAHLRSDSVDLVVTSPPYPMIEMWDELFSEMNAEVGSALTDGRGQDAFELMHDELFEVWKEVERVVTDDGIVCINIGDATRTVSGEFELYPNAAEITSRFQELGFQSLPEIHWRKTTNKKTKFMGSGMLPPNAYTTLEHEKILVFRKNGTRQFPAKASPRYEAAYFWEERNEWFTDEWDDVGSVDQSLPAGAERDRAAAYPLDVPYRLINMFSVYGDTVLDPFFGTGTTSIAAIMAGRNSIGYDLDESLFSGFHSAVAEVEELTRNRVDRRLQQHREFSEENSCSYEMDNYDMRVKTKQEREIALYVPESIRETATGYEIQHTLYEP